MKRSIKYCLLCVMAVVVGAGLVGCFGRPATEHSVLVVLTQEAIDSGKVYTIEDFSEIKLKRISVTYQSVIEDGVVVYSSKVAYLELFLKTPSLKNANKAVKELNKREDVQSAARSSLTIMRPE